MLVTERCRRGADMVNAGAVERIAAGMALLHALSLRSSIGSSWEPVSLWQEARKHKLITLPSSETDLRSSCSETEVGRAREQREHGG